MTQQHHYDAAITWTGNNGTGTSGYTQYGRSHLITASGKVALEASADPHFRGDAARYNPEELFLASIASCHMLWYLHLCADNGVVVTGYSDAAHGIMETFADGSGRFTEIRLRPVVLVAGDSMRTLAAELHESAHRMCFLASSVNFEIFIEPQIKEQV